MNTQYLTKFGTEIWYSSDEREAVGNLLEEFGHPVNDY